MYIVTADEMREMDRQTIESFGLPGRVLMENAARGATRVLIKKFPDIAEKHVAVIAGRGNNGGDGFVMARYLKQAAADVAVYLLADSSRLGGDAADNFNLLSPLNIPVHEIADEDSFNRVKTELAHYQVFVDAILGTGLNSDVRGFFKSVIEFINDLNRPVFAVDIPSGLNTDTGRPCGICIRADATATFGFPKIGLIQLPGAKYCGDLHVIDIGIPPHIVNQVAPRHHLITKTDMAAVIRPRAIDAHKGETGHVLVIAGAPGKTGAAAMTAMAALRIGAGLITLGVPQTLNPILESQVLEVMTVPLPETETHTHTDQSFDRIMELLSDKKCLALGPGMGTDDPTRALVHGLVQHCPVPVVLDADGLNSLADCPEILLKTKSEIILTPHPGEMARLAGTTSEVVQADRMASAKKFASDFQVHVVLKGARTVIAHPEGEAFVNLTGNPGMASAGMGDVLTGMIAGLIAQGYSAKESTHLAVYLHGDTADMLAASKGPYGYIASALMKKLPKRIATLTGTRAYQSSPVFSPPKPELL